MSCGGTYETVVVFIRLLQIQRHRRRDSNMLLSSILAVRMQLVASLKRQIILPNRSMQDKHTLSISPEVVKLLLNGLTNADNISGETHVKCQNAFN